MHETLALDTDDEPMNALKRRLEHYSNIPDKIWSELTDISVGQVSFSKTEDLIRTGDPVDHILIIDQGWALRHRSLDDGRRQICNVMVQGDIFDLQSLADLKADHTVTAASDVVCHILKAPEFLRLLRQSPSLASLFWWASVQEESILREQIIRIGRRSARERIGHLLLELQRRMSMATGDCATTFELPLTRTDLADTLGLTPVHVSRTLSMLRRSDLLEEKGDLIRIIDRDALARMCQFEEDYLHIKRMIWGEDNLG